MQTGSPNKYFDGLAAGKLIIVNFRRLDKEEIEAPAACIQTSRNPAGIVKLLEPFVSDRALLAEYGKRSRKLAETQYSRGVAGRRFAAIFRTR